MYVHYTINLYEPSNPSSAENAGYVAFGDVFDLERYRNEVGQAVLEWRDIKKPLMPYEPTVYATANRRQPGHPHYYGQPDTRQPISDHYPSSWTRNVVYSHKYIR